MSTITYTSRERPVETDIDLPPCCGYKPEVLKWKRQKLVGVYCRNRHCQNHTGAVLCYDDRQDIETRWEHYRNKGRVAP